MVELSPTDDGTFRQGFAGDTFNTAWYLRSLLPAGWQVDYLTTVGDDAMSGQMLDFMRAAGIGTGHVAIRVEKTPRLYVISVRDGERSFSFSAGAIGSADTGAGYGPTRPGDCGCGCAALFRHHPCHPAQTWPVPTACGA